MTTSYPQLFHECYPKAKKTVGNEWLISCHNSGAHRNGDAHPSLSVNLTKEVYNCLVCGVKGHLSRLPEIEKRLPQKPFHFSFPPTKFYEYHYPDGQLAFRKVRRPTKENQKAQYFERWIDNKWVKSNREEHGELPLLPYRLPEVLSAEQVYLVEGEKDAESLRRLGFVATTNATGSRGWKPEHSAYLRGKNVVLLGDSDVPGKKRLFQIGYKLRDIAESVSYLSPKYFGGVKDVSDFLEADPDNEITLKALLEAPEPFPWDTTEDWVAEMNKTYATSLLGTKFVIIRESIDPHFDLPKTDFLIRQDFEAYELENGKRWLTHPQRRHYKEVVFGPRDIGPEYYNLWKGFAVEPKENSELCARFWDHVRDHLVENEEQFLWIKAWCARMVQEPWKPAETVIAIRGPQGVGKSLFATTLGKLFGQHFFQASSTYQFVGRFNAHLKDKVLVLGDESFWGGDKQSEGAIKRLVTESVLAIEPKGKDILMVPNFIHLIMATNEEWVVPAGSWERRFACFNMSDKHQGNRGYFGKMVADLQNGGYSALLYDLLHFDYQELGIEPTIIPDTEALQEQKELSAPNEVKFLMDVAEDGAYLPGWDNDYLLPIGLFYEHYLDYCRKQQTSRRKVSKKKFGIMLTELFGESKPARFEYMGKYYNNRCYELGSFKDFESKIQSILAQKPVTDAVTDL